MKLHCDLYIGVFSKVSRQEILGGNTCTPAQKLLGLLSDYKSDNVANRKGKLAQWNNGATEDGGAGGCIHYGLVK